MAKEENQEVFPRSSDKTYSLVEIVRGPTTMVDKGPDDTVFSFPVVAILELLLALGATAVLMLFSLLKNAPLEELANPIITTDPAKAPWYFLGLQEMLEHMHPTLAGGRGQRGMDRRARSVVLGTGGHQRESVPNDSAAERVDAGRSEPGHGLRHRRKRVAGTSRHPAATP